jgi:hypothetical protein
LIDRVQAAAYAAALTGELATLVRRHRLDTLGYFLDMARLSAEQIVQEADNAAGPAHPEGLGERK